MNELNRILSQESQESGLLEDNIAFTLADSIINANLAECRKELINVKSQIIVEFFKCYSITCINEKYPKMIELTNNVYSYLKSLTGNEIEDLIKLGLLEWEGERERAHLTPRGRLLGNQVFMRFVG